MFCRMCGSQMGEDEKFCSNCGAPASETPAAPVAPEVPVTPVAAPAPVAPVAPVAGNPLLKARSNPLYLAAVICLSVAAVFQLINVFTTMSMLAAYWDDFYYMSEASANGAMIGFALSALAGVTITAIILIGLWMVYASGVGQGKATSLTRGLKLVRGGVLAQMIYMIVILALVALVVLVMIIMGGSMSAYDFDDYYYSYSYREAGGVIAAVGVVFLLILAGVGALMIVFYVKARTALGHALAEAQTGKATGAPSMFVPVMCFVIAGCTVLLMLTNNFSNGLGIINNLATIAANILFGVVALQYRNQVLAS